MPCIGLGGSAVPAAVGERAEALGITTTRSFGSTEHPSITGCTRDVAARQAPQHRRRGRCRVSRLRLVDDDGNDVARRRAG